MAKFKNSDAKKEEESKRSDLFTVITEDEKEEIDEELLKSILADDSLTQSTGFQTEPEVIMEEPGTDLLTPEEEKYGYGVLSEEQKAEAAKDTDLPKEEAEEKAEEDEKKSADAQEKPAAPKAAQGNPESVTVITKGTTINGSIASDCSLDVMGTINGDIECLGKLTISGKVTGNAMASEIFVNTDRFEGNITSEGCVKIGIETIIIGNITATAAVIAGAVKGNIDVQGAVVIDSSAIIKGDVKAKSIQMNNGAVLDGYCSLAYASVDIDKIFE